MATLATPEARTAAWHHLKQFMREQEAERLRLLQMWVSELEPEFVYSRTAMAVMGITVKGWDRILIYAKGWTESAQRSHDLFMETAFYARGIPRDFHWNVGIDFGVETGDRSVEVTYDSGYKISVVVDTKNISPELGKKMLQATMPKVKE